MRFAVLPELRALSRKQLTIASNRRQLAASHQRSWLWGHHAVMETLRARRWPIDELFIANELPEDQKLLLRDAADQLQILLHQTSTERLRQLSGRTDTQGLLARMQEYPLEKLPTAAELALEQKQAVDRVSETPPLYVCLDRIQDPHNFGAILRNCDAVQAAGVIIGCQQQAAVTPHVARASSGAVNHLRIMQTDSLTAAMLQFAAAGFRIAAASEKATDDLWNTPLHQPTVLVIGTEATGIAADLLSCCDLQVRIPMQGQVGSLNAAVAAGILMFECRRQAEAWSSHNTEKKTHD